MTEINTLREIEYFTWKIHKEQQHFIFLDKCIKENILPKLCQISQTTSKRLHLQPQNSLNPCEHRATIVAPAYLKSSKKDKKLNRGIFCFKYIIKNLDSVSRK